MASLILSPEETTLATQGNEAVGHRNIKTTLFYSHLILNDLRNDAEMTKLPEITRCEVCHHFGYCMMM
jgi:hypothetical protein